MAGKSTVILLKGEKNINRDPDHWFGLHGFATNMLRAVSNASSSNLNKGKQEKLNVKTIDVDEWNSLDEFGRIELLGSLTNQKRSNSRAYGI